jgi:hypothetical protein
MLPRDCGINATTKLLSGDNPAPDTETIRLSIPPPHSHSIVAGGFDDIS